MTDDKGSDDKKSDDKKSDDKKLEDIVKKSIEEEKLHREAFQVVLDKQKKKEGHLFALTVEMGSGKSYLTSASLQWVAVRVNFAYQLPIFERERSNSDLPSDSDIEVTEKTEEYIQQRRPDWRRQLPMTTYLAARKHHKFPPLLLVAYQDWMYDKSSKNWDSKGKAKHDAINVISLDSKDAYVDLDVEEGTQYFALDGQHRLMGIKGLLNLLDGSLIAKKQDGSPSSRSKITLDAVGKECNKTAGSLLKNIMSETIGIEIIPAVMKGETLKEAISRLRNIFVDVNQNARRLSDSEIALLDENDGCRIIARKLMVTHNLFDSEKRVEVRASQLRETSEKYTTLDTLVESTRLYLKQFEEFNRWSRTLLNIKDAGFLRPLDEELEAGRRQMKSYFDEMAKLPSHKAMIQGEKVSEMRKRRKEDEDQDEDKGTDKGKNKDKRHHVLFRPIAQQALAEAVGLLQNKKDYMDLKDIMRRLANHDKGGGTDLCLSDPASPWYGVVYDPSNGGIRKSKVSDLCTRMFTYLLGRGFSNEVQREKLKKDFFESRKTTPEGSVGEDKAIDLEGNAVTFDKFDLPNPWN